MVRWNPPAADAQNGDIIGYKIRYRKGGRKSEAAEITSGSQLSQLIDGKTSEHHLQLAQDSMTDHQTNWITAIA